MNIRESQVEDVLSQYPDIAKSTLKTDEDLSLIARQKILPSGERIDLLMVSGKRLLLVELKVEKYSVRFAKQVMKYAQELMDLQVAGKLVGGEIVPYLLCVECSQQQIRDAGKHGVVLIEYSPFSVLEDFFVRMQATASFMSLKPSNHGLWNIHLLNRILYVMDQPIGTADLQSVIKLSKSTIQSYLRLASELLLVKEEQSKWILTDYGRKYIWNRDVNAPLDSLSDEQTAVLQNIILQNPFSSGAISGIYTVVESIYNLSKNTYPVRASHLADYFRQSSGTMFQWNAKKTAMDAMRMYSNYAIDLGLVARLGESFYLTPAGVRFILLLNLHKTIKMIDALGIAKT